MSLQPAIPILAKSSDKCISLEDHVQHVEEEAVRIALARPFVYRNYCQRIGDDLAEAVRQSAHWHDEGKKHPKWQTACQKDYQQNVRAGKEVGTNIRRAGIRHELVSLDSMQRAGVNASLPVRVAVASHHCKLSRRHKDRWSEAGVEDIWNEFVRESSQLRISVKTDFERAIEWRYKFAGPRAMMQLADHRASAAEEEELLPPLESFSYNFPHKTKHGLQREEVMSEFWDEPFIILRAPTGAGKTDTALLWAQHQIEEGRADRLVIAMPTRFTANALAVATANNLSATGLYHSSALYQRTKDMDEQSSRVIEPDENKPRFVCVRGIFSAQDVSKFIDKEQELARKLEMPVTVTTIDHLCICLTGTREDHHAIFFGLAHSCVVIDEADFYDDFTQQNIVTLLRALRVLKVPVLLMSATVPESAREVYAESGMKPNKIYEDLTDYERTRCIVKRYGKAETPEDISDLLQRTLNGEPAIIYVNTVKRAQRLYRWFNRQLRGRGETLKIDDVIVYHSRFTEPHKVEKENSLLAMLGRDAWAKGNAKGVAILTQIGEISVNISADLMISDLCPIDRLAQRAGRLARFKDRGDGKTDVKGELFIIEPQRRKKTGELELYPAPYGHFNTSTKEWEQTPVLSKSIELLSDGKYSPKTFVDLVNQLYPAPEKLPQYVLDNRRALEKCAVLNWLILPVEKIENEDEDDGTKDWCSRDIPPQSTIYANFNVGNFDFDEPDEKPDTRAKRRRFELRHGVKCHAYEFNAARENNQLDPMEIQIRGNDKETVWLVREGFYNYAIGLDFNAESDEW
jgi:CRISPR-associated endonuclease/helicase Cas3